MAKKSSNTPGEESAPITKKSRKADKFDREKLLKDIGRRLMISEEFTTKGASPEPDTEYGVIIYYNGSIKPNL